jgi:hypothetical protein
VKHRFIIKVVQCGHSEYTGSQLKAMELKKILLEKSQEAWENYLPSISIDCVVFGFHAALKVLV